MNVGEKTFVGAVESESDIYLGGTVNILDQPEFASNVDQMKDLFVAFEEKSRLISVLDKCLEETGVNVVIGSETPSRTSTSAVSVTHTYTYADRTIGVLGVLGPKRMPTLALWASSITPRNSSAEFSPRAEQARRFRSPH